MKKLLCLLFALSFAGMVASCKQDSGISDPMKPMKAASSASSASPALTYTSSAKSGRTTFPTIAVMDSDGTHAANVYTAGSSTTALSNPCWSPDGKSVLWGENTSVLKACDVSVVSGVATGSNTRTITTDSRTIVGKAWCSQSSTQKIAYIDQAGINNSYEQGYLYTIPQGGGTPTLLFSSTAGVSHYMRSPTWSPDDKYIAFIDRSADNTNQSHSSILRVIDAATGVQADTADLTSLFQAENCEWARSGNAIAFNDMDTNSGAHFHIYYYTAFSGNAITTQNTLGSNPTWSPSDANLMVGQEANTNVVEKMAAFGTTLTTITTGKNPVKWKR
ncbi:MAG: hypothetical protein Q8916_11765 [Bacteroidota bacterium]|nr:hypothetical protein [Bacteroidota bacterium]MDP4231067.1 hypothetical protein [Bacteroidota bacterium]MDP4235626.1 hypothetical protein [Bacteroidota bacterium]